MNSIPPKTNLHFHLRLGPLESEFQKCMVIVVLIISSIVIIFIFNIIIHVHIIRKMVQ
ncbi:hypothetical protein Lalb_Chr22g0360571 [Lupinus albus]|uniref:Uncharacterized protein n=1 Tax=Lupinus albus TaxID=3870 RepID=A0A6A4NND1_LUPAL|nr:hypothetical protein Lalb_Chr22g0360571 [Lupinus albus]